MGLVCRGEMLSAISRPVMLCGLRVLGLEKVGATPSWNSEVGAS